MDDAKILITGAGGQAGTALRQKYPRARHTTRRELDITSRSSLEGFDWDGVEVIINAAAYTDVDGAETAEGRVAAWRVNADAAANLVAVAAQKDLTLAHISTDYVFDGTKSLHAEDEPFSPLSVYGASKAAGDLVVSLLPRFYILRASWVVGEGKNFVRTMLELGRKGIAPTVVADQIGRLTFADELARAIDHLLVSRADFGTYNVTNSGQPASWADIARQTFELADFKLNVASTTTAEYYANKASAAPRPLQSALDLGRLESTGFKPRDWQYSLKEYVKKELK